MKSVFFIQLSCCAKLSTLLLILAVTQAVGRQECTMAVRNLDKMWNECRQYTDDYVFEDKELKGLLS